MFYHPYKNLYIEDLNNSFNGQLAVETIANYICRIQSLIPRSEVYKTINFNEELVGYIKYAANLLFETRDTTLYFFETCSDILNWDYFFEDSIFKSKIKALQTVRLAESLLYDGKNKKYHLTLEEIIHFITSNKDYNEKFLKEESSNLDKNIYEKLLLKFISSNLNYDDFWAQENNTSIIWK